MSLAWTNCSRCGKRISIAEDGLMEGRCILCNMKQL
jgi:DNA-directed RNA polymerase subunit RPC12/RpoP